MNSDQLAPAMHEYICQKKKSPFWSGIPLWDNVQLAKTNLDLEKQRQYFLGQIHLQETCVQVKVYQNYDEILNGHAMYKFHDAAIAWLENN